MHRRRALAVLGTAFGSGCLRLTGGNGTPTETRTTDSETATATPTATRTATPTDTPTETATDTESPTPTEPSYPNGLTENGLRNFFYDFHRSTLEESSFRVEWSKLDRDHSELRWRRQYEYGGNAVVGHAPTRPWGGPADIYRTDDGVRWRENLGDRYTYGHEQEKIAIEEIVWESEIDALVTAGDWGSPTRVNDSRPAVWEVSTDTVADEHTVPGHYDAETVALSGTIQIDQRGFIRSVDATYRIKEDDPSARERNFTSRYTVSNVGSTAVREPSWVATAERKHPAVTLGATDDMQFATLRIDSGTRIEAGTRIFIHSKPRETTYGISLEDSIEPGTTAYLYKSPESEQELRLSRGTRPTDRSPKPFESIDRMAARRVMLFYFDRFDIA
jgi:hypothetical protein